MIYLLDMDSFLLDDFLWYGKELRKGWRFVFGTCLKHKKTNELATIFLKDFPEMGFFVEINIFPIFVRNATDLFHKS